jgi:hypothetical protein
MALLCRAQIDQAEDLGHEEIEVPEWGGSVRLRKMTAGEHATLGEEHDKIPREEVPFYVLSLTMVGDDYEALYPGPEGRRALMARAGDVVGRLCQAAARINKLAASDVEDAAKN